MKPRSRKAKGDVFERETAAHINDKTGIACSRTPLSGAAGGSDLRDTPGLAVECKRQENVSFPAAMEQAEKAAKDGEMAVVINRRNRQTTGQSYVLMRLDSMCEMYAAWLREKGLVPPAGEQSGDLEEPKTLPLSAIGEQDDCPFAIARAALGDDKTPLD